jgi:hypothetical protein
VRFHSMFFWGFNFSPVISLPRQTPVFFRLHSSAASSCVRKPSLHLTLVTYTNKRTSNTWEFYNN